MDTNKIIDDRTDAVAHTTINGNIQGPIQNSNI